MRNMEKPPLAGLEDDLELPRDCMKPLSQTPVYAPAASTGGEHHVGSYFRNSCRNRMVVSSIPAAVITR
jgi:hypothetical protein